MSTNTQFPFPLSHFSQPEGWIYTTDLRFAADVWAHLALQHVSSRPGCEDYTAPAAVAEWADRIRAEASRMEGDMAPSSCVIPEGDVGATVLQWVGTFTSGRSVEVRFGATAPVVDGIPCACVAWVSGTGEGSQFLARLLAGCLATATIVDWG